MASKATLLLGLAALSAGALRAAPPTGREDTLLSSDWRSAEGPDSRSFAGFEQPGFDDHAWVPVAVPHDWYPYAAVRGVMHGDIHGSAWYRRHFDLGRAEQGRRVFL